MTSSYQFRPCFPFSYPATNHWTVLVVYLRIWPQLNNLSDSSIGDGVNILSVLYSLYLHVWSTRRVHTLSTTRIFCRKNSGKIINKCRHRPEWSFLISDLTFCAATCHSEHDCPCLKSMQNSWIHWCSIHASVLLLGDGPVNWDEGKTTGWIEKP